MGAADEKVGAARGVIPAVRLRLLGTGTSQGIPVIGCRCPVCDSPDPRDKRLRTAALFSIGDIHLAVDVGPDFRQQILAAGIHDIRGVLLTHAHNDHVAGLDDLRPVNFLYNRDIPFFGLAHALDDIRRRFAYVFDETYHYPGKPRVVTVPVGSAPFVVEGIEVLPLLADHGGLPVLGFRIGGIAYLTDAKRVPVQTLDRLGDLDILVLNALRHRPHPSHFNLAEAAALASSLRPGRCVLTHISHDLGRYADVLPDLPEGLELGVDGMVLSSHPQEPHRPHG